MSRVLLIRPLEDALPMATVLRDKGIDVSLYPLYQPHFLPIAHLEKAQAFIITSKNALRALKNYEEFKTTLLYVVGDKTAELAKRLGFLNVLSASGTSQELIALILATAKRDKGVLWHLSGEVINRNIADILTCEGFEAERKIVYYIEGAKDFSPSLCYELENQQISHVIFCSPRTTSIFIDLLQKKEMEKITCKIVALCLSQEIEKNTLGLRWKKLWVSPKPNMNALMRYFDEE